MNNVTESHVFASIVIGGKQIPFITDAVVVSWLIVAFLIGASILLTRRLKNIPGKGQNFVEIVVELISNICRDTLGVHGKTFAPYIGAIFLFILTSNLAGIFNIAPQGGFFANVLHIKALENFRFEITPPTKNFNVVLCLTFMSVSVAFFCEFHYKGLRGWMRSFYRPMAINGFIKILDYVVRPTSLCLRLFGNIIGGFIVIELIYHAFPPALPAAAGIYFDLFDGALQAYIFVFLTMVYIKEASEEE
ncbi:MAG: F0F1 ATP synthase subunit A [Spirochaetaceae bacterium]|jgi:F-type H+-transporting ATPase subunit a|nr:F0F1 ATP synthase subunit A [Spirochaetaceae bacterium]